MLDPLLERLDRLPLPIELAASRCDLLTPAEIRHRLSDQLTLLEVDGGDRSDRARSLRGALEWSWRLLGDEERGALRQISAFEGGFPVEAAEFVLAGADPDAPWPLDALRALRDRSLLYRYEPPDLQGETWFDLYQGVRDYVLERDPPTEVERDRVLQWLATECPALDKTWRTETQDRLSALLPMLEAQVRRLGTTERAIPVVLWMRRALGRVDPARGTALVDRLLPIATDPQQRARLLRARADMAKQTGDTRSALADALAAFELGLSDPRDEVALRVSIGSSLATFDRLDEAAGWYTEALEEARAIGDARAEQAARGGLGNLERRRGRLGEAREHLLEALALGAVDGNQSQISRIWLGLANTAIHEGRFDEAVRAAEQSLALARRPVSRAFAHQRLGWALYMLDRREESRAAYERSLALAIHSGEQALEVENRVNLAVFAEVAGDHLEAEAQYRRGLRVLSALGRGREVALTHLSLASVLLQDGRIDDAERAVEVAASMFDGMDNELGAIAADVMRGAVAVERAGVALRAGDADSARQLRVIAVQKIERATAPGPEGPPRDRSQAVRTCVDAVLAGLSDLDATLAER